MAKYSFEFKKKVVVAYENKEGGYKSLAKKYCIPSVKTVETWYSAYKEFGDKGLMRFEKRSKDGDQQWRNPKRQTTWISMKHI